MGLLVFRWHSPFHLKQCTLGVLEPQTLAGKRMPQLLSLCRLLQVQPDRSLSLPSGKGIILAHMQQELAYWQSYMPLLIIVLAQC